MNESYRTGVAVTLAQESEVTGGIKGLVLQSAFTSYKAAAAVGLPVYGWAVSLAWVIFLA